MIRRSLLIAAMALLLSLGLHLTGLGFVVRVERTGPAPDPRSDIAALGNSFEDIADQLDEPDAPAPLPEPEQPETVEPVQPPTETDVPDTEVLVASENPQDTYAPDTGTAQIVAPVPLAGTQGDFTPEPDTTEPTSAPDDVSPVTPQDTLPASRGTETELEETETPEPEPSPETEIESPVAPEQEVIASLPESLTPIVPVTPLSEPEITAEPEDNTTESAPQPLFPGLRNGFDNLRNPSQTVESPLETFRRDGAQAFVGGFGIQSGSAANSRGPGNSDTTNYAGRVLVHLNRTRPVHVKAVGFARVYFEINPDGSLNWVEIIDSSGNSDINRAARAQIQSAVPFPIPPNGASRALSFMYSSR